MRIPTQMRALILFLVAAQAAGCLQDYRGEFRKAIEAGAVEDAAEQRSRPEAVGPELDAVSPDGDARPVFDLADQAGLDQELTIPDVDLAVPDGEVAADLDVGPDGQPPEDAEIATETTVSPDLEVSPECVPQCDGKTCGDNGCGGSCGECQPPENVCMEAQCDAGVCIEAPNTASCDDGDPCTVSDTCGEGVCAGQAKCVDGSICTLDLCDAASQECSYPPNPDAAGSECDDGNPCTETSSCADGVCKGVLVPVEGKTPQECFCIETADCGPLEDGDLCNGTLFCNQLNPPPGAVGYCDLDQATVLLGKCSDTDPCTIDECDPEKGCDFPPKPCEDGVLCTKDNCNFEGVCDHVPDNAFCDDAIDCTTDMCNPSEGCVHLPDDKTCDDGAVCTDDTCDVGTGCQHKPNSAPCDDGSVCTVDDVCEMETCKPGPTLPCDDGIGCTGDSCDPLTGCLNLPQSQTCDDGDVCTDDVCVPKTGCVSSFNTAPCEDQVACTVNDACSGGDCMAGVPDNAFCDDENGCTEDSCDPLSGCLSTPNDSLCDDGNGCTEDSCDPLSGCLSTPNDSLCDDGNECTDDNCLPGDKGCVQTPVPDLTPCGGNDVCVSGQCVCIPKTCKDFGPLCGQMADGCGGLTPDCFPCAPGSQCSKGLCLCPDGSSPCGGLCCPALAGYDVTCNAQSHCEYANEDNAGWKKWDVWIWIPPGSFQMGSSGEGGGAGETPVHQVTFAKGYFIGKYEIVVEQYEACKAANPGMCTPADTTDWNGNGWGTNTSANNRSEHPQNGLTWQQAKDFCAWSAPSGRLPSEAEWEYAASGPVHRKYPWGDSPEPTCSNNTAVFNEAGGTGGYGCSQGGTWKVGSKSAGAAWSGALDMSGNLWEWTEDWDHGTYTGAPADGSAWVVPTGSDRVIRNGSFYSGASLMRSAGRTAGAPDIRRASHGGRCVRPL